MMNCLLGDGSTHGGDPWSSSGGAPLQPGPYGYGGGQVGPHIGPTPPLMTTAGGPNNPHMAQQQPPYPTQGIFSQYSLSIN